MSQYEAVPIGEVDFISTRAAQQAGVISGALH